MKVLKWFDEHFEETVLVLLLILISCVELVQVIIRNIPWIPSLTWAEEFCRFCWIWSVFLSLPYTIREGSMLRVSVLPDLLPDKSRKTVSIAADLITAGAMFLLGWNSVSVVRGIMKSQEKSPAMLWPMWIIYSIMLIGFFGGGLRALRQAGSRIRNSGEIPSGTSEQGKTGTERETGTGKRTEGGDA